MAFTDTIDQYSKAEGVNFSTLKNYLKSPAHYRYAVDFPEEDEDTKAKIIGRASHCMILEEREFPARYEIFDPALRPEPQKTFGSLKNKEFKRKFFEDAKAAGKDTLDIADFQEVQGMAAGVRANEAAMKILKGCKTEHIITWVDPDTKVPCKALIDLHDNERPVAIAGDIKSMDNASPGGVSQFMAKWNTHVQLAFYADGLSMHYGKAFSHMFLIAVEKKKPHVCQPYYVDERALELGRTVYKSLLNIHRNCVDNKFWGSYDSVNPNHDGVIVVDLPVWMYAKTEANQMLQNN